MGAKQGWTSCKTDAYQTTDVAATGYRPASWQRIKLASDPSGNLSGILHQAKNETSVYENFNDGITRVTRLIYKFSNLKTEAANVPLNLSTPTWMRGPGDCTGVFALESAIDELSYQLKMDPVALRLKEYFTGKNIPIQICRGLLIFLMNV